MKLFIKNVNGLVIPKKANESDAMYDVVATTEPNIVGEKIARSIDSMDMWQRSPFIEYGTNLFVAPEVEELQNYENVQNSDVEFVQKPSTFINYHLKFYARSSISKYNLLLCNGVGTIDNGYRAQVFLRYKYIFQPEDLLVVPEAGVGKIYGMVNPEHIYQKGDKIAQFEACQNSNITFELVDKLPDSQRGLGGFGSSGK